MQESEYWADRSFNQPRQPWEEAQRYAEWAGLRLPSEAVWEYACRAGTRTRYYTSDTEADLGRAGWYRENSDEKLHLVGEKAPNAFGLCDMHGNVWEWVEDDWHDNYRTAPNDGRAWVDAPRGALRVIRGGGWASALKAAGRRIAAVPRPSTATTPWASALPGLLPLALDPLYPWPRFCRSAGSRKPPERSRRLVGDRSDT